MLFMSDGFKVSYVIRAAMKKLSQRTTQHITYIQGRNILKRASIETRAMNSGLNR